MSVLLGERTPGARGHDLLAGGQQPGALLRKPAALVTLGPSVTALQEAAYIVHDSSMLRPRSAVRYQAQIRVQQLRRIRVVIDVRRRAARDQRADDLASRANQLLVGIGLEPL